MTAGGAKQARSPSPVVPLTPALREGGSGRRGEAREVATLVAYLASPLSSATNGAAIRAEGGILPGIL